jgi:hypothetical protein
MHKQVNCNIIILLLIAILITQLLILNRMPPTIGEIQNANTREELVDIIENIPLVQVNGGKINANIWNEPLKVQIEENSWNKYR